MKVRGVVVLDFDPAHGDPGPPEQPAAAPLVAAAPLAATVLVACPGALFCAPPAPAHGDPGPPGQPTRDVMATAEAAEAAEAQAKTGTVVVMTRGAVLYGQWTTYVGQAEMVIIVVV